jgi:3-oxoacyl-[acyl-carrier protein] reductase
MIILTGASGGIGQEIIPYLEEFDDVIGIYNKNKPTTKNNSNVKYVQLNLLDANKIESFINEYKNILTNITVIHGAAVKVDQLAISVDEVDWDHIIESNLKSNFLLSKALLPLMIEQSWGRIISLTSTGAMRGAQGTLAYSASKSGLSGLTRVYAIEYARFNITANLLSLGYFECGLFDDLSEDVQRKLLNQIPSKKLGNVENISLGIDFLIKSDFTNGSTINIDGGI